MIDPKINKKKKYVSVETILEVHANVSAWTLY